MNKVDKYISDFLQDMLTRFPNIVTPLQYQYYESSDMHFIQMQYSELFEDNVFANYCLAKYREFLLKFGSSLCVMRPDDVLTLDNPSIIIDIKRVYYPILAQKPNYSPVTNLFVNNLVNILPKKEEPNQEISKSYPIAA